MLALYPKFYCFCFSKNKHYVEILSVKLFICMLYYSMRTYLHQINSYTRKETYRTSCSFSDKIFPQIPHYVIFLYG